MIDLLNVTKIYNENKHNECKALNNLSLNVKDGEFIAIMGKSGSGKSTLLNIISGLDNITTGEISIKNIDISKLNDKKNAEFRREHISFIFQNFFLIEELNVYENVMLSLSYVNIPNIEKKQKVTRLIHQVGLEEYIKKPVYQLSGGEKQRVAIARALTTDASILLADEPTGSLDSENANKIMDLLDRINKKLNKTVIIVTHDYNTAQYADRIIIIKDGAVSSSVNIDKSN